MKNYIFCLLCLFSTSTLASSFSSEVDHSVPVLEQVQIEQLMQQKHNNCFAQTVCYDGRVLTCQTYGANCTFYTAPGRYVQCTGYNAWGQWVNLVGSCY